MKKVSRILSILLCLFLSIAFLSALLMYARPMKDVSLDLSLGSLDDILSEVPEYDSKGWTVYTQDGAQITVLTPDGFGGYTGLELGQTFYYSRVMTEELDSPTLQLSPTEYMFSVWLDDTLLYTDCPELDNRIGYLTLPMNEWFREAPITISLPMDYQGKTLTIAQSFPMYSETGSVRAWPTTVHLYCGYAYESSLISESYTAAIVCSGAFLIAALLLCVFLRNRDWGLLALAIMMFSRMSIHLTETTFFWKYYGSYDNTLTAILPLISTGALLVFLTSRAGKHRNALWVLDGLFVLSVLARALELGVFPYFEVQHFDIEVLFSALPHWLAFVATAVILVLGFVFWRKENRFYRLFTPMALISILIIWLITALITGWETMLEQIRINLSSGQIIYMAHYTLLGVAFAAVAVAIIEAVHSELCHQTEKRLMEQQQELTQKSYENLRSHMEEVAMMRHDLYRHFTVMQEMKGEDTIKEYLNTLVGQYQAIRPVVHTGNKVVDLILNGRLSAAMDSGIRVDVEKSRLPEHLPLSDTDLCSLLMNMIDNAIQAASTAQTSDPYIHIKIHVKNDFLALLCENSADTPVNKNEQQKEAVPRHGLGLKIIRSITERCGGMFDTECSSDTYKVQIVIPMIKA